MNNTELFLKAILRNGKASQVLVAVEEMQELSKELLKNVNRNKENRTQIIDETADVQIMIEQLKVIYSITETELQEATIIKLKRLKNGLRG